MKRICSLPSDIDVAGQHGIAEPVDDVDQPMMLRIDDVDAGNETLVPNEGFHDYPSRLYR